MGERKTDNHSLLVIPGVQATEHQTNALGDPRQTQAVGDHERSVETELPEWLQPFTELLELHNVGKWSMRIAEF